MFPRGQRCAQHALVAATYLAHDEYEAAFPRQSLEIIVMPPEPHHVRRPRIHFRCAHLYRAPSRCNGRRVLSSSNVVQRLNKNLYGIVHARGLLNDGHGWRTIACRRRRCSRRGCGSSSCGKWWCIAREPALDVLSHLVHILDYLGTLSCHERFGGHQTDKVPANVLLNTNSG